MSLKAFHVVFVTLSTLLGVGFGVWAIGDWSRSQQMSALAVGIASLVGAVAMVVYGVWFLRKLRNVSWL